MAADRNRMLGCPICGYRVSAGEEACPRCGSKFDKGTKYECPFCGSLVDANATECPSCFVNYQEFSEKVKARGSDDNIDSLLTEIIRLESSQVKEEPKRFSCPSCSWMLDGSEVRCPKCGADLSEDFSFQCPVCGSTVSATAAVCPLCGAGFTEDLQKKPAQTVDVERTSSKLDEIVTALGMEQTEEELMAPEPKPAPVPARAPAIVVKPEIIKTVPKPVPVHEPVRPAKTEPQPAVEEAPEIEEPREAQEPEKEPKPAVQTPAKKKTRKLKAKPKQ